MSNVIKTPKEIHLEPYLILCYPLISNTNKCG